MLPTSVQRSLVASWFIQWYYSADREQQSGKNETNITYGTHDPPPSGIVHGNLTLAGDTPFCDEVSWPTTNESPLTLRYIIRLIPSPKRGGAGGGNHTVFPVPLSDSDFSTKY